MQPYMMISNRNRDGDGLGSRHRRTLTFYTAPTLPSMQNRRSEHVIGVDQSHTRRIHRAIERHRRQFSARFPTRKTKNKVTCACSCMGYNVSWTGRRAAIISK